MTEMTRHEPGMLCWTDLMTTDLAGAKRFYGELFGWEIKDQPMPEGGAYAMAYVRGKDVGGMGTMPKEMKGVPPHWNTYISVTDVDEVAKRVAPAGGKVVAPPFDVMDVGRMAIVQDPTGATLSLWQPKKHVGARLMMEPGSLVWAELMTRDTKVAGDFYAKVLGWERQVQQMPGGMRYTVFAVGQAPAVGMMDMPKEAGSAPSSWGIYFAVAGCDDTVAKAQKLGGKVHVPGRDIEGVGRFALLQDPQGAYFSILQPSMPTK